MTHVGTIYTEIPRPSPELVAALGGMGVATLHEAMGRVGLVDCQIRPLNAGQTAAGPAVTAHAHPGDNLALHVALHYAKPGDILVATAGDGCLCGSFGDLMGTLALARGIVALVTDGGVRDSAELRQMGLPVWARAITAQGTVKETLVAVNAPVVCGGTVVNPGDIVVADDDGVVVVPLGEAEEVLARAQARQAKETLTRQRYSAGISSYESNNLGELLSQKGIRTVAGRFAGK